MSSCSLPFSRRPAAWGRRWVRATLAGLALVLVAGCDGGSDESAAAGSAIVNVPHTLPEAQTIGNCWLYAHGSWIESMNLRATGEVFDVSQSYWTYWHWLEKVAAGESQLDDGDVAGSWETANRLIRAYGLIDEGTFVGADARGERSERQREALAKVNVSLQGGALASAAVRSDRKKLRAEMDRIWGLGDAQREMLDVVFGGGRDFTSGASNEGTPILRAEQLPVAYFSGPGREVRGTLAQAMQDWHKVEYTGAAVVPRIQRAVHDLNPVYMSWLVDFNALETSGARRGSFTLAALRANGSGRQGIHMTVVDDYQAVLADGGVLRVGRQASQQELARALEPGARVEFFRVKNSWGTGGKSLPRMPGYNDLYLDYLNGPVAGRAPLRHVYLPKGY